MRVQETHRDALLALTGAEVERTGTAAAEAVRQREPDGEAAFPHVCRGGSQSKEPMDFSRRWRSWSTAWLGWICSEAA